MTICCYNALFKYLKTVLLLAAAVTIVPLLNSCGWITAETDDQEVIDMHKDMRAEKRETVFEKSLERMAELLRAYGTPVTPVQCKNLGNQTAEQSVPTDLYVMASSAINKIGRPLIFVPYDVQYVVGETTTGGKIERLYPQVVIAGGITGFDQDMVEKEREVEAEGGWAGASGGARASAEGGVSRVVIDLSMLDYKTQAYFPGVVTSNSILLRRDKLGWGAFAYYMGNGASFDYSLKHKQGVHAALRTVLEFSIIELIGKQFEVPYWKCIEGALPDVKMAERLRDEFSFLPEEQQALKMKKILFLHGHDVERTIPKIQGHEEKIIRTEMSNRRCSSLADLYIKLWGSVPIDQAAIRMDADTRYQQRLNRENQRLIDKDNREKAAAAAEAKKQQEAEFQTKVNSFRARVEAGDEFMRKKNYAEAENSYRSANQLFPGEPYPVQQLKVIQELQAQQQQAVEQKGQLLTDAEAKFKAAEGSAYNQQKYRIALQACTAAAAANPDNQKIKAMIQSINAKLAKHQTVLGGDKNDTW
jgi:tetratricopeptide (TPR) repeat protein